MTTKDNNQTNKNYNINNNRNKNNPIDIKQLEKIILEACLDAGKYIKKNAFDALDLKWKKLDDPVTVLDKNAEQHIRKQIGEVVQANFYGEEYGIDNNKSEINVYIDPIDGTKSFARGEFLSSVSIAADYKGQMFIGVVYDFMRDILYYATNEGAFVKTPFIESKKLPVYDIKLSRPTISFGNSEDNYIKVLQSHMHNGINSRKQAASVALSMAQLAAGSYDGLILPIYTKEGITDTCDIAAGYYIMKQAGIKIKDYNLNEYDYRHPHQGIIAWNKNIIDIENIILGHIAKTTPNTHSCTSLDNTYRKLLDKGSNINSDEYKIIMDGIHNLD